MSGGLWALRDFARLKLPSTQLSPSTLLVEHPNCIAVFDVYPKAKYHFLVLPRLPFPAADVGEPQLDSLAALLRHPARDAVIEEMERTADEVVEMIRDEMSKSEGKEWGINVGFHAVPSMRHLHLHIISDDLISSTFKTKKHYNSFRPDLGFFVHLREVKGWLTGSVEQIVDRAESLKHKDPLLNTPLTCFKCGMSVGNMPTLKRHLEDEHAKA